MYLWSGYSPENVYVLETDEYYSDLIRKTDENKYAFNLNTYSFSDIFIGNISSEFSKEEHFECLLKNADVTDMIIHYIINIDRNNGISVEELKKISFCNKIRQGEYGTFIKDNFFRLSEKIQDTILHYIYLKEYSDNRHDYFELVLKDVFSDVVLYFDTFENKMYIFTSESESGENMLVYRICEYIFKTIFLDTEVRWRCRPVIFERKSCQIAEYSDCYNII